MQKIKVLCLSSYYLPGYKSGGPVRTISAIVEYLKEEVEFNIVTSDRDLLDVQAYPSINQNVWSTVMAAHVYYLSPKRRLLQLLKVIRNTPHEILYLNSFFDPIFSIFPLISEWFGFGAGKIIVLAPRGEFSEGALKIKPFKKKVYIRVASLLGLYSKVIWHASSEFEADDIRRVITCENLQINVASDLALQNDDQLDEWQKKVGELRICFISRISPKKNLHFALKVLAMLNEKITFHIYGPVEDKEYWNYCLSIINNINQKNIDISYEGAVNHADVNKVFACYDLFFFPTLGENFGHVILESMLSGTPVLISNTSIWRNLQIEGVGWDLSLNNMEAFCEVIKQLLKLLPADYDNLRKNTKKYAVLRIQDPEVIHANRKLFECAKSIQAS